MSLFKEPFDEKIVLQLDKRQEIFGKNIRSPQDIAYLNSKSAWVQLRSSVDIDAPGVLSAYGLASDNVLLGGSLLAGNIQRKGMIGNINDAGQGIYDVKTLNKSFNTTDQHLLGIKPMPGINNISIQSKSAYGSLRQATINFQCWDVKQLDVLETLYMRPGYTLLLEWGWYPYIDNEGTLVNYMDDDKLFFGRKNIDIQKYLSELRQNALDSYGNYDAMFGYIKNYSWKLRNDGGYDCMTEIISTGEMLESFKLNYSGASISTNSTGTLLSNIEYGKIKEIQKEYRRNTLAGLLAETYALAKETAGNDDFGPDALSAINSSSGVVSYTSNNGKTGNIYYATKEIELEAEGIFSTDSDANDGKKSIQGFITDDDSNVYITLRSFVELLNNFILLENPDSSEADRNIIKLSVDDRPDSIDAGQPLHCLYNPLQISVDPRVCIIKNDLFEPLIQGINITDNSQEKIEVIQTIDPKTTAAQFEPIIQQLKDIRAKDGSEQEFRNELAKIKTKEELAGISDYYYNKYNETFYDFLTSGGFANSDLDKEDVGNIFGGLGIKYSDVFIYQTKEANENAATNDVEDIIKGFINKTPEERQKDALRSVENKTTEQQKALSEAKEEINSSEEGYLSFCNRLSQAYHINDITVNYGVHGNIFLNLRMLYNLAGSEELEGQDPAEKQTVSLMSYMKDMLTMVQNSIGNVNNFEVIIEGNVGYIVDVNNVPSDNRPNFTFSINEKNSLIKDISLESQIFSDQSTIIAVAAQSDAGKLGLENSSMVAYNLGIKDRNIFRKESPINNKKTFEDELQGFILALYDLKELFDSMDKMLGFFDSELLVDSIPKYKKSLTDIIVFFTSYFSSSNKYRALLPTKLSLTLDGIGGLIIGNKFNIDSQYVPKIYQGDNAGFDLGYIITNIKQEVNNSNQWNTTIEGNPYIDDNYANELINGQQLISTNITLNKVYSYDESTGTVTSKIVSDNISNIEDRSIPPGLNGDDSFMSLAMKILLKGPKVGKSQCNMYTFALARNFLYIKNGRPNEARGYVIRNESGGNAATPGAFAGYEKLGYKTKLIGTNVTKADMEKNLGNSSNWDVGDVVSYVSSDGVHYHAQIFTGGLKWDPTSKNFLKIPGAALWATDDATNYKDSSNGTGNFVYRSENQNSYKLWVHYHRKEF